MGDLLANQAGQERLPSGNVVDGRKLADLRNDQGWTQVMLAERAGVSVHVVRKIEQNPRGSALLSTLSALAAALDVPVGVFFAGDGPVAGSPGPARPEPTLLRHLMKQRHWRIYKTFEVQFRNAAQDLARRDREPRLAKLTVSPRQFERWYAGEIKTAPHTDACRVLEYMFGCHISALLAPYTGEEESQEEHAEALPTAPGVDAIPDATNSEPVLPCSEEDAEDPMRRRSFFVSAATLAGLLRTDPAAAFEAARHQLLESIPGRAGFDLADWGNIVQEYGESYPVTTPGELIGPLLADFTGLSEAFRRYQSESAQRELFRVTGMLAGFLAQTINKLGHSHEAKQWWRVARYAADRAGDPYSPLWVRAREIIHATIPLSGRSPVTVLRMIDKAEPFAGAAPSELALEFLAAKAETFAMAGREVAARRHLSQLYARFEASTFSGYGGSLLGWGEERLRNSESFILSRLGDYEGLEASLSASAAVYKNDLSNCMWPANNELHRAFCLVRQGDVSAGTSHVRFIVDGLPRAQRDGALRRRTIEISRIIPSHESAVGEYREWIDSTFPRQPALTAGA